MKKSTEVRLVAIRNRWATFMLRVMYIIFKHAEVRRHSTQRQCREFHRKLPGQSIADGTEPVQEMKPATYFHVLENDVHHPQHEVCPALADRQTYLGRLLHGNLREEQDELGPRH